MRLCNTIRWGLASVAVAVLALPLSAQFPFQPTPPTAPGEVPVYRVSNHNTNEHIYTTDPNEVATLLQSGQYTFEGATFEVGAQPGQGLVPLYRCIRPNGMHFLTTSPPQQFGPSAGQIEHRLGYIATQDQQNLRPLFAWMNPDTGLGFYTTDPNGEYAMQSGYQPEGLLGYVVVR